MTNEVTVMLLRFLAGYEKVPGTPEAHIDT